MNKTERGIDQTIDSLFSHYQVIENEAGTLHYHLIPTLHTLSALKELIVNELHTSLQIKFKAINPKFGEVFDFIILEKTAFDLLTLSFDYEKFTQISLQGALEKIETHYGNHDFEILDVIIT